MCDVDFHLENFAKLRTPHPRVIQRVIGLQPRPRTDYTTLAYAKAMRMTLLEHLETSLLKEASFWRGPCRGEKKELIPSRAIFVTMTGGKHPKHDGHFSTWKRCRVEDLRGPQAPEPRDTPLWWLDLKPRCGQLIQKHKRGKCTGGSLRQANSSQRSGLRTRRIHAGSAADMSWVVPKRIVGARSTKKKRNPTERMEAGGAREGVERNTAMDERRKETAGRLARDPNRLVG